MPASNYSKDKIADWLGGNGQPTATPNIYVKLHLGAPGADCTSNPAANTTRIEALFGAASGGIVTMSPAPITWTSVPNSETYAYVSLWDAATAGNALGSGALSASVAVTAGNDFDLTALTITVT